MPTFQHLSDKAESYVSDISRFGKRVAHLGDRLNPQTYVTDSRIESKVSSGQFDKIVDRVETGRLGEAAQLMSPIYYSKVANVTAGYEYETRRRNAEKLKSIYGDQFPAEEPTPEFVPVLPVFEFYATYSSVKFPFRGQMPVLLAFGGSSLYVGTESTFTVHNVSPKTATESDIRGAVHAIVKILDDYEDRPLVIAGSPTMVKLDHGASGWAAITISKLAQKVRDPSTGLMPRGAVVDEILTRVCYYDDDSEDDEEPCSPTVDDGLNLSVTSCLTMFSALALFVIWLTTDSRY